MAEKYDITGMSCAACSARVEKAVSKVEGVTSCSVNLLTESMTVEGTATSDAIIAAVKNSGYGAMLKGAKKVEKKEIKAESSPILKRFLVSLGILIILMYVSMGHTMWGFPLPKALEENPIAIGLIQLILSAAVMVINQKFFISGFKGLIHRAPNMDTLVSLGSTASFVYSVYALFAMSFAIKRGESGTEYLHEFYFEAAAMILVLITLGKMLEAYSKGRTTDALKSLMNLAPKTATVIREGEETVIPAEKVQINDIFLVKAGESVPVDGIVLSGNSAVDESALTGESIPVDKKEGDSVSAATISRSGVMRCRATRVGEDTTLSQIIKTVSDAVASKAPIAKIADKVSGVFVPVVMAIAIITVAIWLIVGRDVGFSLARGISVLVISCPCALGLATPVAIMVGSGIGAKKGILFKTATALEEAGKVRTVVLDKTGTVTKGEPTVTDVFPYGKATENSLIEKAFWLEKNSEHPLAKAIVKAGCERNAEIKEVTDFETFAGNGLCAVCNGKKLFGGNFEFVSSKANIPSEAVKEAEKAAEKGETPLFFCEDDEFLGIIAVADVIKEDSEEAVSELKNMGIKVIMLTGDNEKTAKEIGKRAGVDEVIAEVKPDGKEKVISDLKKYGKVAMVGDGINDAPALTRADIGMAIGAGTDVAVDAADVVLVKSSLKDVSVAIRLSRATLLNIKENLFWAFFYNSLGIPLAAGAFISLFGWQLNPMIGAAAMSLSSVCVVTNALRLNLFNLKSKKQAKNSKKADKKEKKAMIKTMKIEGMMCAHCEARVKKTLEAIPEVKEAAVSHTDGTATVTLSAALSDEVLKNAVEAQDYAVTEIK